MNFLFFVPMVLIALPAFFFICKLWSEIEASGRQWMIAALVWSMPFTLAPFAFIFHINDGAELLLVAAIHLLIVTCILRRINKKAG